MRIPYKRVLVPLLQTSIADWANVVNLATAAASIAVALAAGHVGGAVAVVLAADPVAQTSILGSPAPLAGAGVATGLVAPAVLAAAILLAEPALALGEETVFLRLRALAGGVIGAGTNVGGVYALGEVGEVDVHDTEIAAGVLGGGRSKDAGGVEGEEGDDVELHFGGGRIVVESGWSLKCCYLVVVMLFVLC